MKVTPQEYAALSEIGPYSHYQANETHNVPKNTMRGYGKNLAIRVVRNGEVVKKRHLGFMALELINDRQNTEKFRRLANLKK